MEKIAPNQNIFKGDFHQRAIVLYSDKHIFRSGPSCKQRSEVMVGKRIIVQRKNGSSLAGVSLVRGCYIHFLTWAIELLVTKDLFTAGQFAGSLSVPVSCPSFRKRSTEGEAERTDKVLSHSERFWTDRSIIIDTVRNAMIFGLLLVCVWQ